MCHGAACSHALRCAPLCAVRTELTLAPTVQPPAFTPVPYARSKNFFVAIARHVPLALARVRWLTRYWLAHSSRWLRYCSGCCLLFVLCALPLCSLTRWAVCSHCAAPAFTPVP